MQENDNKNTLTPFKEIFEKAKDGDKNSFSEAYSAYFSPLYRYIYLRIGNKAESDDLIQDVFIKAHGSTDDCAYSNFSAILCLYSIARKSVADWKRKRRTVALSGEAFESHFDLWPRGDDLLEEKEETSNMRAALRELPDEVQDAVILRFTQGLSVSEVSDVLGREKEDVYTLLSKGVCSIRDNLKKIYDEQ